MAIKDPYPSRVLIVPAKDGCVSFTMSLAAETDKTSIGVYAFNPGMMLTELLTDVEVVIGSENRLKVFPTVIRLFARPPEVAAERAAWIASSATDGKTGKLYNLHSNTYILKSGLRWLWQKLTRQRDTEINLHIHPIPPYDES